MGGGKRLTSIVLLFAETLLFLVLPFFMPDGWWAACLSMSIYLLSDHLSENR